MVEDPAVSLVDWTGLPGIHIDSIFWGNVQGGPGTSYKWGYNPYKWPYKCATEVITLLVGVITPFVTSRGPPCREGTNAHL